MLSYEEFAGELFAALGRHSRNQPNQYINLDQLAQDEGIEHQPGWIREEAKSLKSRGLVQAFFSSSGSSVMLTAEGWREVDRLPTTTAQSAPPEDTIIAINHASPEFTALEKALSEALEALRSVNAAPEDEPDAVERLQAEVRAGQELLRSKNVRLQAVVSVLAEALRYIAKTFANSLAGRAASSALAYLEKLLDTAL